MNILNSKIPYMSPGIEAVLRTSQNHHRMLETFAEPAMKMQACIEKTIFPIQKKLEEFDKTQKKIISFNTISTLENFSKASQKEWMKYEQFYNQANSLLKLVDPALSALREINPVTIKDKFSLDEIFYFKYYQPVTGLMSQKIETELKGIHAELKTNKKFQKELSTIAIPDESCESFDLTNSIAMIISKYVKVSPKSAKVFIQLIVALCGLIEFYLTISKYMQEKN